MLKFLQINLRKSGRAHSMLEQTARELATDVLLLSEISRGQTDPLRWVSSLDGKSAVALTATAKLTPVETGSGIGFACMVFPKFVVYSCYWKPGGPLDVFESFLAGLETDVRTRESAGKAIILAGDFNAKSQEWGSAVRDNRGVALELFCASLSLWSENVGSAPTFSVGHRSSVIDVIIRSTSPRDNDNRLAGQSGPIQ